MTNKIVDVKKYEEGIWTPWGEVLCSKCLENVRQLKIDCTTKELEEDNEITTCNKCNKEIQIDKPTANENNIANRLRKLGIDACMEELGGMNSACAINKEDSLAYYLITFNWNGDNEFYIGSYDEEGDYLEDVNFICDTMDEMIEYVLKLKNVKRL